MSDVWSFLEAAMGLCVVAFCWGWLQCAREFGLMETHRRAVLALPLLVVIFVLFISLIGTIVVWL